jgi:endonuclease VIII
MPEGDSVAGHAELLRPILVGRRVEAVSGTAPSVRVNSTRILDAEVVAVRTVGKHLVIDLSTGYSIRVHLGMPGRWRVSRLSSLPGGSARLVLTTATHHAACYSAPTIEVDRTPSIDASLARLGPDLLGDFDTGEFIRRARLVPDAPIADLLLNQRVLAGIGNVYKSEVLFLERLNPTTAVSVVDDERLASLARRAASLLSANVGSGARSTTGRRGRGQELWVYGRGGRPCRRCGSSIVQDSGGERVTYWCPTCQPT